MEKIVSFLADKLYRELHEKRPVPENADVVANELVKDKANEWLSVHRELKILERSISVGNDGFLRIFIWYKEELEE